MKVRRLLPELEALQYDGSNQDDIDRMIGGKSERHGDTLLNPKLGDFHAVELDNWVVLEGELAFVHDAAEFAARFARS